jgi:hypothetical protein
MVVVYLKAGAGCGLQVTSYPMLGSAVEIAPARDRRIAFSGAIFSQLVVSRHVSAAAQTNSHAQ